MLQVGANRIPNKRLVEASSSQSGAVLHPRGTPGHAWGQFWLSRLRVEGGTGIGWVETWGASQCLIVHRVAP